ncbi:hypothetical protein CBL_20827, partial [Carabus blaptoides fortunei]
LETMAQAIPDATHIGLYKRFASKLLHLLERLARINSEAEDVVEVIGSMRNKLDVLETTVLNIIEPDIPEPEPAPNIPQPVVSITPSYPSLAHSGASHTIVGHSGREILKQCGVRPDTNTQTQCTVANNTSCQSIGSVSLPVSLEDKCHLIKALIVPAIPHEIILGVDFWIAMDIVPNLKLGTWAYASSLSAEPTDKASIQTLSETQQHALITVLEKFHDLLTDRIGRTNVVEHCIDATVIPIKQRYYPVNPKTQEIFNRELDKMITEEIVEPSWSSPALSPESKVNVITIANPVKDAWYRNIRDNVSARPESFTNWKIVRDVLYKLVRNTDGLMGKHPEVSQPWQMISLDFMEFPKSTRGHAYLL